MNKDEEETRKTKKRLMTGRGTLDSTLLGQEQAPGRPNMASYPSLDGCSLNEQTPRNKSQFAPMKFWSVVDPSFY